MNHPVALRVNVVNVVNHRVTLPTEIPAGIADAVRGWRGNFRARGVLDVHHVHHVHRSEACRG